MARVFLFAKSMALKRRNGSSGSRAKDTNPIRVAQVALSEPGNTRLTLREVDGKIFHGISVPSMFGGLFGFRAHYTPPAGSFVYCLRTSDTDDAFVFGAAPGRDGNMFKQPKRVADGGDYANQPHNSRIEKPGYPHSTGAPIDLVEGEYCVENDMGVMVSLLTHLCKLQAGDRARLEMSCLNDMVRLVSQNFIHQSALGEHVIRNAQGKLWMEWHAAAEEFEAEGRVSRNEPKLEVSGKNKNVVKGSLEEAAKQDGLDGRWHMSLYVGWLGDFINLFFSDPPKGIRVLTGVQDATLDQARSGKQRYTVGRDGSVLIQSVSDIVLERVVRIPVPLRMRGHWDPAGDIPLEPDLAAGSQMTMQAMKALGRSTLPDPPVDDEWKPSDSGSIHEMVYQIRHYARWLNQVYTMRQFRGMERTFVVPPESLTPAPEITGYAECYSTIRIFRDGSQLLLDAYNNAVHMTREGITISSSGNLRLEARNNVYIVSRNRISMLANGTISLSSVTGNIKLKAKDALSHLLSSGSLVLKSLAGTFGLSVWGKGDFEENMTVKKIQAMDHNIKGPAINVETGTSSNNSDKVVDGALKTQSGAEPSLINPADAEDADQTVWYESLTQQAAREQGGSSISPSATDWQDGVTTQKLYTPTETKLDTPDPDPSAYTGKPPALQSGPLEIF